MRRCCHRLRRRLRGDQSTPPCRQYLCSTSATRRHHHGLGHLSSSHCRHCSIPRRRRYPRLRAHRCLPPSLCRNRTEASADIRSHPVEDGAGLRCANELPLRHAGRVDLLAASTTQALAPPQRRVAPVDDKQDCVAVDGDLHGEPSMPAVATSRPILGPAGQPSLSVGDHEEAPPVVRPKGVTMCYGGDARYSGGHRRDLGPSFPSPGFYHTCTSDSVPHGKQDFKF